MLFDLRARGRRRTIQVIYLGLAILMGGGLIFFGIGGNTSGGLFDAFKSGGSSSGAEKALQKKVNLAAQRARANPQDAALWAALTKLQFQEAGLNSATDASNNTVYDSKGVQHLRQADQAWQRYLALSPKNPDPGIAGFMTQVYAGPLRNPKQAVASWEIVVDSRPPSFGLYYQLAQYAYAAGQSRKGDLAAQKALALAPKAQRKDLKAQLDSLKSTATTPQTTGSASGAASG